MSNLQETEEIQFFSVNDDIIPETIREVALSYDEVKLIVPYGDEYWLCDEHGELIESVWIETKQKNTPRDYRSLGCLLSIFLILLPFAIVWVASFFVD